MLPLLLNQHQVIKEETFQVGFFPDGSVYSVFSIVLVVPPGWPADTPSHTRGSISTSQTPVNRQPVNPAPVNPPIVNLPPENPPPVNPASGGVII